MRQLSRSQVFAAATYILIAVLTLSVIMAVHAMGERAADLARHASDLTRVTQTCLRLWSESETREPNTRVELETQLRLLHLLTGNDWRERMEVDRFTSLIHDNLAETDRAALRTNGSEKPGTASITRQSSLPELIRSAARDTKTEEDAWLNRKTAESRATVGWIIFWSCCSGFVTSGLFHMSVRVRCEQSRAESDSHFQTLVDSIPQLCWIADSQGWIFWYNRRWYEYTGTTPEKMAGWGWQSVHNPDTLPAVMESWTKSIATRSPFEMIFPLRGADGVFRPFLTRVVPVSEHDGKTLRWFGTNTEIGKQRSIEQALRDSEERLRLAQQVALVGTFDWDIRTGLNRWTPELEAMYGLEPGGFESSYSGWEDLVHPEDRQSASESVRLALSTGHFDSEWRVVWPDGSLHWLYGRGSLVRCSSGEPIQMIGVNIDITERKVAEQALRDSESRYSALAEALPAIIFTNKGDGEPDYVNTRWQEYTGLTFAQSTAPGFNWPIHPDDRASVQELWTEARKSESTFESEFRLRRADGVYRWFRCRATPLRDEQSRIVRWLGISSDAEDEKKSEERLRQAQKMEAMGRLAGGVAHDFNNLLTAISGYNGLLLEQLPGSGELAGYATEVQGAADRATALTRQLLTFSRREISQPKLLNVNEAVHNIRNLLARVIGEDIRIHLNLTPNPGLIRVDPLQFDQVVMNLAVNARDAMPEGGNLTFGTTNFSVRREEGAELLLPPGEYICLGIADTGCGMDDATKKRLFEPFFTTKESGKGTGLGLSIVYGIVQQNHGTIRVESEPGRGSGFHIYFPVAGDVAENTSSAMSSDAGLLLPARGKTILLVEDENIVRQFATEVLRRDGFRVLDVSSPSAAMEIASRSDQHIDLLLTDVLMPEMRGPELVNRVLEKRTALPVLFMSGYSDSSFLNRDAMGEAKYLQKPFTASELLRSVDQLLQRQSSISGQPRSSTS